MGTSVAKFFGADVTRDGATYRFITNWWGQGWTAANVSYNGTTFAVANATGTSMPDGTPIGYPATYCGRYSENAAHGDCGLPAAFSTIAAETMVPFSHILWAHVWLGLAADAFRRAQRFVRDQALGNPGTTPPSALRLSELSACMAEFRALVQAAVDEYMSYAEGASRAKLSTIGYAVRINNLKIAASEAAAHACGCALRICGMLGYRNEGPYSVGRQLRDAHSAALMVSNDRLHSTNAALLLVHREGK